MFYVKLVNNDGKQVLGNVDGQGFYRYKRVSSVVNILEELKITNKNFLQHCGRWEIYQCNESDIYGDKSKFKLIEAVSCH